ncbi:hypothetical protein M501DRAFT_284549 [Patellaria atrata CBS 101060]|uniref:BZIP domain-containing protein n=1 Tax=Patellaria atrata CBS 101060 TaxID=1346257 RepID=A0A9P4S5N5_9PEZI|nr:hypothetical protein M501DRAFT_284549 [Patellaria atrata CBS 101060]
MEPQHFDYWLNQNNVPYQPEFFEVSSNYEMPLPYQTGPYHHIAQEMPYAYPIPMTPSDFSSADESPYHSPQPRVTELSYPAPERTHTTSGRRRAQNRAAQRAFRERKEKHAKDLESQLASLTDKFRSLETSHAELNAAYDKLRKTIELLTKDEGPSNSDTLRKLLEILHGEVRVKVEGS